MAPPDSSHQEIPLGWDQNENRHADRRQQRGAQPEEEMYPGSDPRQGSVSHRTPVARLSLLSWSMFHRRFVGTHGLLLPIKECNRR